MTAFVIGAALLMATAFLFVLPPLLRRQAVEHVEVPRAELNLTVLRDQMRELEADLAAGVIEAHAYESARHDLERRVAEEVRPQDGDTRSVVEKSRASRLAVWIVALALPAISISLYLLLGTPAALDPKQVSAAGDNSHSVTPEQIEAMVTALAQRLKNDPDNVEGWNMLARSYNALGRFEEASTAYERLVKLVPNDANLLADYADTMAMALNKSLQGEPEKVIDRALAIDPNNIKALALAGSAAFERRDYATAIARWQKILPLAPADSDLARSIQSSINEAMGLMGAAPSAASGMASATQAAAAPASQESKAAAVGGVTVEGVVELDPALRAQAADNDTVFIFVRAAQGPRFPLAVLRKQVKDLPATFVLDDTMSMTPNIKLSDFSSILVGARISKSGSATPSVGDLEGLSEPVSPGVKNLKIRINQRKG